jgi:hypothetical protein
MSHYGGKRASLACWTRTPLCPLISPVVYPRRSRPSSHCPTEASKVSAKRPDEPRMPLEDCDAVATAVEMWGGPADTG